MNPTAAEVFLMVIVGVRPYKIESLVPSFSY